MYLIASASAGLSLLLCQSAVAQAPEGTPTRLRGTVERVERDEVDCPPDLCGSHEIRESVHPTAPFSGSRRAGTKPGNERAHQAREDLPCESIRSLRCCSALPL
jgi:hypothetical protein